MASSDSSNIVICTTLRCVDFEPDSGGDRIIHHYVCRRIAWPQAWAACRVYRTSGDLETTHQYSTICKASGCIQLQSP